MKPQTSSIEIPASQTGIPFNRAHETGNELTYIAEVLRNNNLSGDGPFAKRCHQWLEKQTGAAKSFLTPSCTAALEMAALLVDVKPGDEIIMPSFTFASTANAFVLRGAIPVFVDIRCDTLNVDETLIEAAITPRTRAIVLVHYAGVACELDRILDIARRHGLYIVEDAAQGVMASYKARALGAIGDLGTYSFHETKNIVSGEGGCLLVNNPTMIARAEIIREKGTDRSQYLRGAVDKYTWQDVGSSYLPNEITAAFLWAQLEQAERITHARLALWRHYDDLLTTLAQEGILRRPIVPETCQHNAHMYYVLLAPDIDRHTILNTFRQHKIGVYSHYEPLHASPAGIRYGRYHGELVQTERLANQLIRLPLWIGLTQAQQEQVITVLEKSFAC